MNVRRGQRGFALPTVMIAGVILMMILASALSIASSSSAALREQYYGQLLREAAEAGTHYAESCYPLMYGTTVSTNWPSSGMVLATGEDCSGNAISGISCGPTATDNRCYVAQSSSARTRFEVTANKTSGSAYDLTSTAYLDLINTNTGQVIGTRSQTAHYSTSITLSAITSGNDTTCVAQQGQLYCWGQDSYGQVGDGQGNPSAAPDQSVNTAWRTTPYHVAGITGQVQAVATGFYHTCAIVGSTLNPGDGNKVWCWGSNAWGQFGNSTKTSNGTPQATFKDGGSNFTGITARNNTCFMANQRANLAQTSVYCLGNNDSMQSGESSTGGTMASLVQNPKMGALPQFIMREDTDTVMTQFTDLSGVSDNFECSIAHDSGANAVWCWGSTYYGQFGNGFYSMYPYANTGYQSQTWGYSYQSPRAWQASNVTGMTNPVKVHTNNLRVCAVTDSGAGSGDLYCWGNNESDGGNGIKWALDSAKVSSTSTYPGLSAGSNLPLRVAYPFKEASGGVTDVAVADYATCYLKGGSVYCYGYNDRGELGTGNNYTYPCQTGGCLTKQSDPYPDTPLESQANVRPSTDPYKVQGALAGQTVTKITAGNMHFCALTSDNNVYCWGGNASGQLGDGSTTDRYAPASIAIPQSVYY